MTDVTQNPSDRQLPAARLEAIEGRMAEVEARLGELELAFGHINTVAEAANHLARVLDPRTLSTQTAVERLTIEIGELRTLASDLQRMAATLWDATAVANRLERIEDVLAGSTTPIPGRGSDPGA